MAAGDAPATLLEMITDLLEAVKEKTGVTALNTLATRCLNDAIRDLHQEKWWWQEIPATIRTFAPYSTGSIDIAITTLTTRRAVTGTGTAWNTTNSYGDTNAQAGEKMLISGAVHKIAASGVTSDTAITLDSSTPFMGTAALDDSGYTIYQDEYALPSDYDGMIDMKYFDDDRTIRLIGPKEFYQRFGRNSVSGRPKWATVIQLGPSSSVALRQRVVFAPYPSAAMWIPYRYYTRNWSVSSAGAGQQYLSANTDEPLAPHRIRQYFVEKAKAKWLADRSKDTMASQEAEARAATILLRERQMFSPTDNLPRITPDVDNYVRFAKTPWAAGGRGAPRYDTGDGRFDQLA